MIIRDPCAHQSSDRAGARRACPRLGRVVWCTVADCAGSGRDGFAGAVAVEPEAKAGPGRCAVGRVWSRRSWRWQGSCSALPGPSALGICRGDGHVLLACLLQRGWAEISGRGVESGCGAASSLGEGEKPEEVHARGDEHGTWVALRVRGGAAGFGAGVGRWVGWFPFRPEGGAVWGHQSPHTAPKSPAPPSGPEPRVRAHTGPLVAPDHRNRQTVRKRVVDQRGRKNPVVLLTNPLDHLGKVERGCVVPRTMRGRAPYPCSSHRVGRWVGCGRILRSDWTRSAHCRWS
ncbi:hypothetical protein HNR07_003351 [Nocardiopsis metallicus]|uniref:Uncharacterized protein n=1 Tax=Nocardiopsis metallicus TaxID=179819 RepID=A0A840W844_9ACTN|nr:hypothetical protein [Nocardiopsis metallicus]